jgi:hypothetical protein
MGHRVLLGGGGLRNAKAVRRWLPGLTMPLETAARCGASVHVKLRPAPLASPRAQASEASGS